MKKIQLYTQNVEEKMLKFYNSLSEKDRRRYAAIEVEKLGYGGISYISRILHCSDNTIYRGQQELMKDIPNDHQIRAQGAGRKRLLDTMDGLDDAFLRVLDNHTAGSPMNEAIKWTNLSRTDIVEKLLEQDITISVTVVDQLLEKHGFRPRQAFKVEAGKKNIPQRDEQFKNIERLKQEYIDIGAPVLSMDVKKKELIGNFYRSGTLYTQEIIRVNDHDFPSYAEGKVIPHGLYDIVQNIGYVTLGISHDTSEFACECIRRWWLRYGSVSYRGADKLLLLCDCGGSNSTRYYLFKEELQRLSNDLNIEIRIAHYPPYTSKYNPIEHRLFPHITKACKGVVFKSVELVNDLMGKAKTTTGLKVFSSILNKTFETGRKVADGFKENMRIQFDDYLPQWNYFATPEEA